MTIGTIGTFPKFRGNTLTAAEANSLETKLTLGAQLTETFPTRESEAAEPHNFYSTVFNKNLSITSAKATSVEPWLYLDRQSANYLTGVSNFSAYTLKPLTIESYACDWLFDQLQTPSTSNYEVCQTMVGNGTGGTNRTEFGYAWAVSSSTTARILVPTRCIVEGAGLSSIKVYMLRTSGTATATWTGLLEISRRDGTGVIGTAYNGTATVPDTDVTIVPPLSTLVKNENYFVRLNVTGAPQNVYCVYKMVFTYSSTAYRPPYRVYF